ncbi:MAG: hypothetical protein JXQ29_12615 [Planctomycetes bacterium]|nr:hypothetical protein [Planctomycetota bacterium]
MRSRALCRASLLVCVCLVAQHLASPLHVLAEDHCRITEGPGAHAAGVAARFSAHPSCSPHDHSRGADAHLDPACGPDPHAPGSTEAPLAETACEPDCCAGSGPHCPHPVEEHLAEMRGEPARAPSLVPVQIALVPEIMADSPDALDPTPVHDGAPKARPPRLSPGFPARPRAPPAL